MKTEWDYTTLADAYLLRPNYADAAVDAMLSVAHVEKGAKFCDVGAGAAHLTRMLAARGFAIVAVEPNDVMRAHGIKRTQDFPNVYWYEGTGEQTGQSPQDFAMVTFGSSFNVCDRQKALKETARILKPQGWFACMWNHRQLDDPIQSQIERIIKEYANDFAYGTRREDQTAIINASELFGPVIHIESHVIHKQTMEECIGAWYSHATLKRQVGAAFNTVVSAIEKYLINLETHEIQIPYSTHIWLAQLR